MGISSYAGIILFRLAGLISAFFAFCHVELVETWRKIKKAPRKFRRLKERLEGKCMME
jgi:hypothetical protein